MEMLLHNKKSQNTENQLFTIYETRMKSLMQVIKVYQENIQIDNQSGALAFMKTQQMALCRIDRCMELLKDALLTEKEKLLIKVLTSCQQLKKQNQKLKKIHENNNQNKKHSYLENVAQKDFHSKETITDIKRKQKEVKQAKKPNVLERLNSVGERFSHYSLNDSTPSSSTNLNIYQKLLQDKIILIKQLQRKNKQLTEQIHQINTKLHYVQSELVESRVLQSSECQKCITFGQIITKHTAHFELLKAQNQKNKITIKQQQTFRLIRNQELSLKDIRIKELETKIQTTIKQMIYRDQQNRRQIQELQRIRDQKPKEKQNSNKVKDNLQTISQLKSQIVTLEQQLMLISSHFNLLKEDVSESLQGQVKKLKNANQRLKSYIKQQLVSIKTQMMGYVMEVVQIFKEKIQSKNKKSQMLKRLRQIDNQIDFFIEQKQINV